MRTYPKWDSGLRYDVNSARIRKESTGRQDERELPKPCMEKDYVGAMMRR
jgi:hypothetical protein